MSKKLNIFWPVEEAMKSYQEVRDSDGSALREDDVDSETVEDLHGFDLRDIIADLEKEAGQELGSSACSGSGNEAVAQASVAIGAGECSSDGSNRGVVPVLDISEPEDESTSLASGTLPEKEETIAALEMAEFGIPAFKQKQRIYEYAELENQCQRITILNDSVLFYVDSAQSCYHDMLETLRSMKKPPESTLELAELAFQETVQNQETTVKNLIRALKNGKNASLTLASIIPESQRALTKLKRGESAAVLQRIVETNEGPFRYGCDFCTKSYSRPSDLRRHIKMVHMN